MINRSSFRTLVLHWRRWTLLSLSAGVCFLLFYPTCGTGQHSRDRVECTKNLEELWIVLLAFVGEHGDLPRDASGAFSLVPLGASRETLSCPSNDRAYLIFPTLETLQIDPDCSDVSAVPIVFDPPHSHVSTISDGRMLPTLLLSNGHCITVACTVEEYREWAKTYASGSTQKGTFPPPGHWVPTPGVRRPN
jgi:hypothetical protein